MKKEDIIQKVENVVKKVLGKHCPVHEHHTSLRDFGADSLDAAEIIFFLEEKSGEPLYESIKANFQSLTINDLVEYLLLKTKK